MDGGGFEGGFARPAPVPKMVADFVQFLYRHIRERNINEVYVMYSATFPHLSERFFKGVTWPPVEAVLHLVDGDHVFGLLYKEMYYRHLYASTKPTLEQRIDSWANYRELFSVILGSNLNMLLPNIWLWDMVDEFVYQFQSFCQYRGKLAGKSPEDLDLLKTAEGMWEPQAVVAFLNELVTRSGIREELAQPGAVDNLYKTEGYGALSNVRRMLGYFSLVGLLRVYSILGDYTSALKSMAPLHPFLRKSLFVTKIPLACITFFYYVGFAYCMMQRWLDAAKCFNFILGYIAKAKHQTRGAAYEQILKKNEQMYALLACATALCPTANRLLDEAVSNMLREKYGEKVRSMTNGSSDTYEELFTYACPKFVSPAGPDFANPAANTNMEAFRAQLRIFMAVVEERKHLPSLKQFLKLYSSIPLSKLASLAEIDMDTLKQQLGLLRQSTQVVTWTTGDPLAGAPVPAGDVEFSVEQQDGEEMVVVAEPKAKIVKGDFLVRHIARFEEIVRELDALPRTQQPAAPAGSGTAVVAN
ncbi:eukaryotic translation initiation factor 3 subunit L-like [Micractinium conductrix]|uniref:Eukaryotic translation initiation factor 3 subunit L n=1 Tax=Micractinium conductrix TaxID=554055 RepID=A0A2P6VQS1_9CHLO|nr:eukaryotic translation initiation factor 3 subunit L-like [Micractinium conductrix]|eukprot:PSC76421.1 eukaryotic translation initiation factor 3 subunit L-like [Micractinium conductrix]